MQEELINEDNHLFLIESLKFVNKSFPFFKKQNYFHDKNHPFFHPVLRIIKPDLNY